MCCMFVKGVGYSYDMKWVYLGTNKKLFRRNGMSYPKIIAKLGGEA